MAKEAYCDFKENMEELLEAGCLVKFFAQETASYQMEVYIEKEEQEEYLLYIGEDQDLGWLSKQAVDKCRKQYLI